MGPHAKTKTAYILAIHKNPEQVNKFIMQMVSENQGDVYIHIDKKSFDEIKDRIIKHPNVFILRKSIEVIWGDITQVDATLLLMKEVMKKGIPYNQICFRSGQDLLVKNGFSEFLFQNSDKIFMNAYPVDKKEPHAAFANVKWPRFARKLYINPLHPKRLFRRSIMVLYGYGVNLLPNRYILPKVFELFNGSNWFCMPLEAVKYIIEFIEKNDWYYKAFIDSLCPDEFFFQTLIMNSHFKSQVVNDNLMYIQFGVSLKSRNNPVTLRMEHISTIQSSNQFFARKFDQQVDSPVIEFFSEKVKV
ncbi:beta-1,6-N-acetylglucosaminyltransferase [Heyndrickxia acidicola]|uniref:Peptide O-xylosyltransferase n=1 Tax=Heyndrickxia acidicola TaxID=209389 RepID=A0ABU6MNL0_9BACI|nr:beta-1,6-N-acetylglucosaminyltransferase [Heyndrickxia acidicola]MED1205213.1 beta-1,6-N-acetylglucosaminyltransferase [Heyndrickxia acidicola]